MCILCQLGGDLRILFLIVEVDGLDLLLQPLEEGEERRYHKDL